MPMFEHLTKVSSKQLKLIATVAFPLVTLLALAMEVKESYGLINAKPIAAKPALPHSKPVTENPAKHIVGAAIFGTSRHSSNIKLPKTKLQLILRGAFTANNPQKASAIIEDSSGQTKHVKIGQVIFQNTTLQAVHSDRIVLATNDNLETLYFPESHDSIEDNESDSADQTGSTDNTDQQRQAIIKQRLEELRKKVRRQGQ